jgi:chromosome segregation protein
MGEQSARHLRGRSMDDVIFSGSESRSPNDFAEVTITFDTDAADELSAEFKDYPEIAVTRRLHRTGESEYLINKTPVRLRDVTDLFLGTGAGTKAYSIVEQGKVGLIVSAKPEDRRMLIEEAAGITKFKSRKKQAERKMELTQQNLLRVGDIVSEIERSLASLKRQAAKAERYVNYRGELEDLQLHEAAHRYLELVGWIKLEASEVEVMSHANEAIRAEAADCERQLDASRLEVRTADEALQAAQEASFAADSAVAVEQSSIERAQDRLRTLAQREQQAEGEKHEMNSEAARLEGERDLVVGEIAALAATEAAQLTALVGHESALADLASSHASADAYLVQLRQTIATAGSEIASGEASLAGLARRRTEMTTRSAKLGAEREVLEGKRLETVARADALRRAIEDLRGQHLATAAQKAELEQRLIDLKQRIRLQEQALEDGKSELSQRRSRLGALEEMHTRLEGVGAGAKALVGTHDPCVLGLVADRVEAPRELTQALAGLLGVRLENVVVNDLERGITLLEELGRTQRGRAPIEAAGPAVVRRWYRRTAARRRRRPHAAHRRPALLATRRATRTRAGERCHRGPRPCDRAAAAPCGRTLRPGHGGWSRAPRRRTNRRRAGRPSGRGPLGEQTRSARAGPGDWVARGYRYGSIGGPASIACGHCADRFVARSCPPRCPCPRARAGDR